MNKIVWKIVIWFLLRKKKKYYRKIVKLKNGKFAIDIYPYHSLEDMLKIAADSGVLAAIQDTKGEV